MRYQLATLRSRGRPGRDSFKVHCGTVWGTRFQHSSKFVPQCTLTIIKTRSPAQPQSGRYTNWSFQWKKLRWSGVNSLVKERAKKVAHFAWPGCKRSLFPRDANLSLHLYQPCRPKPIHTNICIYIIYIYQATSINKDGSLYENKLFITSE